MMEKRNVIEEKRTPEFSKQAEADKLEKRNTKLFKGDIDACHKPNTKFNVRISR